MPYYDYDPSRQSPPPLLTYATFTPINRTRRAMSSVPPMRPSHAPTAVEPNNVLGVFGLSIRTGERDLEDEFGKWGDVEKVIIVHDQRVSHLSSEPCVELIASDGPFSRIWLHHYAFRRRCRAVHRKAQRSYFARPVDARGLLCYAAPACPHAGPVLGRKETAKCVGVKSKLSRLIISR